VSKSLEKLSSGFRINRAGDDASGLAISEKMKAQIAGLEQASANAQDGISLIQTAEGATTEIHNMLNRMVTLATKSANGTIQNEVDRENIQTEVNALKEEITRIAKSTNFNGINLLDGSLSAKGAVGAAGIPEVKGLTLTDTPATAKSSETAAIAASTGEGTGKYSFTVKNADGSTKTYDISLETAAEKIIAADDMVYGGTADGKATANQLATALIAELNKTDLGESFTITDESGKLTFKSKATGSDAPEVILTNFAKADRTDGDNTATAITGGADAYQSHSFVDGDVGKVFTIGGQKFAFSNPDKVAGFDTNVTVLEVATEDKIADTDVAKMVSLIEKQTGYTAEIDDTTATQLNFKAPTGSSKSVGGLTLQVGDTNADFNHVTVSVDDLTAAGLGISGLDVSDQIAAGSAIQTIKDAINKVSTNRGNLGALQNRLEYTINNLDTTNENMQAANSRIRDTDMAKEMMNYTKMNILTQAAQAMLAQANQQPQSILQLLQ
ncbi:MAG: flagellin, partial [Clostridiales bacterium]|nr:flagellin [Clostridiales bacterium]